MKTVQNVRPQTKRRSIFELTIGRFAGRRFFGNVIPPRAPICAVVPTSILESIKI